MNTHNKNRVIILAVEEGNLTIAQAAQHFGVSQRWIYTLKQRYRTGGLDAVDPQPKTPHHNPKAYTSETITTILNLRNELTHQGLDNGAHSIHARLPGPNRPSIATIWRILKRANLIDNQPQKRPRSSWQRFEASQPNECWQSDFTHWRLADGTDTEIINWLDDHSRYLLHCTAHQRITVTIVVDTFTTTADTHGLPASTLTDNGMVYTARLARGNNKNNPQPNAFEQLLADLHITQKNGRPNHPTTQGKIERFHQTLKRWLKAQPPATTLAELNTQLDQFRTIYNETRPHRALANTTPHQTYTTQDKAYPYQEHDTKIWRIRYDKVDTTGQITLRYAGKLRKLHIGRAYKHQRVIALIHDPNTMIIDKTTGEIIAKHTINPATNYQPKKPEQSHETP